MISVEQHLGRILDTVRRLPPIELGLLDALGCVLAEDVRSAADLPGFTNSAMDGYAVHAADVAAATDDSPVRLPVVNDIAAGNTQALSLAPGQSMRIMTGAPLPHGADAVVPVELTDAGLASVAVRSPVEVGQHVRPTGDDVHTGDLVLRSGGRLGPRQLALLAAVGRSSVRVVPKPRVVVVSTGDELVEVGRPAGFGQVVDSNGLMLTAAVRALGAVPFRVGPVVDDAKELMSTLEDQLVRADAVITSGGVSAGAYDTVKEVLSRVGTVRFDKVSMQPGMPQGFGVLGVDETPVFTLPGNPVSAMVSFEVFVAPALRAMAGRPEHESALVPAVVETGWTAPAGKTQFARAVLHPRRVTGTNGQDCDFAVTLVGSQGSHVLGGLAAANCLAVIPAAVTEVQAGDVVRCHLLGAMMEA
ncbi:molybdotransferase-like divisome protein Glp [Oryzihumus leptocrescens]|uniref:Molybdopterin molybdenumtransferase n=1 Tax=Oryzihumus leptocrescens TaxID=297536 RepID=A0A542ZF93_9MICO|nr:gephyrin-like molybdotransferase Glp [Oryzihumus leptocrescens]TQL58998.1 molybdopterin molybdochelatase [Oryzihumus leptocrescens]